LNIERVRKLEEFLHEDPGDPFTIYALATEWMSTDIIKAKNYFDQLLSDHPSYIGTYYHAARVYIALDLREKAEQIFKSGISEARRVNENHALSELQNAYNEFLYEDDN
jgi:Tfp pilus assembly protein PilF